MTRLRPFHFGALLLLMPGVLPAQESATKGWLAVVGVNRLAHGLAADWTLGPALSLRRMLGNHFAVDLEATWLMSNSKEEDLSGVLGSLGPAWAWRGNSHTVSFGVGFLAGTVERERGSQNGVSRSSTLGLYAELKGAWWFGPTVGVSGRAGGILWYGDPGSSLSAGLALRW